MVRETRVQSQVESYQRLKKCYLMLPCLTLCIIRYGSRVKWSNSGKGVAPSPTRRCSSYWKGSFRVTLDQGRQLYFTLCIQEHKYYHSELKLKYYDTGNGWIIVAAFVWKKFVIAGIGSIGMFLRFCVLKSLNSIVRIQLRMKCYI